MDRAQLIEKCAWLVHLIGDKVTSTAHDSTKVVREYNCHCYAQTGNGGPSLTLSSSPSFLVGFSIHDKAMDAVRPAPQGDHYYVDGIYLFLG